MFLYPQHQLLFKNVFSCHLSLGDNLIDVVKPKTFIPSSIDIPSNYFLQRMLIQFNNCFLNIVLSTLKYYVYKLIISL